MIPGVRLDEWRSNNEAKRALVRDLVMRAVEGETQVRTLIEGLKDDVGYATLPDKDRNGFNVMASQARAIVERWRHLDPSLQRDFTRGLAPYSRLYAAVKKL